MKLKTSKFELHYEKGALRWIKSDGIEIVRMIYSAVRDHNWVTIEAEIVDEKIQQTKAGFQVGVCAKYKKGNIYFEAEYIISGTENQLIFEMKGEAKSTFMTNRVGFCVLHPITECTGKTCTVFHPGGTTGKAVFPELISPTQPMINIAGMEWKPANGISAKLQFSGDTFEMEDQRNWTDASYKTYCRPLDLPFPFEIIKGEKVTQKIVLEIQGELQNETNTDNFSFSFDKTRTYKIPEIGFSATSRIEALENNEAELLKGTDVADSGSRFSQSPFQHLRAEIKLFENTWLNHLKRYAEDAEKLEIPLFLVLYFSSDFKNECADFISETKQFSNRVGHFLIVNRNHLPDKTIFNHVFTELKKIFPATKIGAGVNAYFAELNRNRDISENAEFISFAISPQIHAFDNDTLVENLEAQKYVVESARQLFPEKPILVSPVTLKQRFNVVATSEEPEPVFGELPSQVDTRQNSLFAAQWLLGSLKYLTQSGAELVTYFESVGWRGFIQGNYEPTVPEKFQVKKGDIFPIYKVIKELEGFSEAIDSSSSHPLLFDGLLVKSKNETKLFLFNFSPDDIKIELNQSINTKGIKSVLHDKKSEIVNDHILLRAYDLIVIHLIVVLD